MILSGKKILVGITGGIAAYKTCELIRQLIKQGADVKVILTPSAKEFVTEITLRTLSKNQVYSDQFNIQEWKPEHVNLADDSDLFIIAPSSANTLGKIANGICDNLLTSITMAFKKPVIIAPAMNCNMWENKFFQENLIKLRDNGFHIIDPEEGELACGYQGMGRMVNIDKILDKAREILCQEKFLKNKKIVITAGGTKEPIDPVRYIGNHSSGKMGIALADAAYQAGAEVTLITTLNINKPYKVSKVLKALEMLDSVKKEFVTSDILVMAAAVADFRPKNIYEQKFKKDNNENLTLELVKNPDILQEISKIKQSNQILVGFCAESENLLENAEKKIKQKNLDFIVANDISNLEIGFNSDYNAVSIIDKSGNIETIPKSLKTEIAKIILKKI